MEKSYKDHEGVKNCLEELEGSVEELLGTGGGREQSRGAKRKCRTV